MRLDKFLAESGIGGRKECRIFIKEGLVQVNKKTVTEPAQEIDELNDNIEYKNKAVIYRGKVYYMFNKPKGCVTARKDEENRTVFDYFKDENMNGVTHVGRLDKDTEGFLILTNDGDFNHALTNPDKHIDKKYYFIALGNIDENKKSHIENGMNIGEHDPITKNAKLEILKSGDYSELEEELNLQEHYSINKNYYNQPIVSGYLTLVEGRKHQVKRMLKLMGCYVIYLKRVSIGKIELDKSLEKGKYRHLTKDEVNILLNNEQNK